MAAHEQQQSSLDQRVGSGRVALQSPAETQALGEQLGASLRAGDVVILDGPLGAGKTTFTQGLARGLKVKGRVTSPTFVIARLHRSTVGGPDLMHIDAYRLLGEDPTDLSDIDPWGAIDSLDLDTDISSCVLVAEWGKGVIEQLAPEHLLISFVRDTAGAGAIESEPRVISWQVCQA